MASATNDMSRREWLRGWIRFSPEEPTPANHPPEIGAHNNRGESTVQTDNLFARLPRERAFPVHRPPRAVAEVEFLRLCTRCGDCLDACPYQAITLAPPTLRVASGTPIIDVANQPCWLCPDQPCVTACRPGALQADQPLTMGTAMIDPTACLAFQGSFCTVCSEQCPVEGAIVVDRGRPTINNAQCVGCGVCFFTCPAPEKAIVLMPQRQRSRCR